MECIPLFQALNQQLENIKQEVVKNSGLDYRSQDARLVALDSIQMNMAATAMWINGLNSLVNFCTDDGTFNKNQFLNSVGSGLELAETEVEMFKLLKLGHITLIHFKLENLFQNLCTHLKLLPEKEKKYGFWLLTDIIYNACKISDGDSRKSLVVLTQIRNSLHNNGAHRHPSIDLQVGQFRYQFIEGELVNCASWEAMMNLLYFNAIALQEVLLSKEIAKIEGLVIDQFATQLEMLT
jgi:hypothetical protein